METRRPLSESPWVVAFGVLGTVGTLASLVPDVTELEKDLMRWLWTDHPHVLVAGLAVATIVLAGFVVAGQRRKVDKPSQAPASEVHAELARLRRDLEEATGQRQEYRDRLDKVMSDVGPGHPGGPRMKGGAGSRGEEYVREEVAKRGRRLRELRELVMKYSPAKEFIELLRVEMVARPGGDISVVRTHRVRLEGTNPLHFWRFQIWGEPMTEAERQTVDPEVRMEPGGGKLNLQIDWDGPEHVVVFADFPSPIQPNNPPFTLVLTYHLPRALAKLYGDGTENVLWSARKDAPLERLEYRVLVEGLPPDKRLNYVRSGLRNEPVLEEEAGRWRIEGYEEPPEGDRFGFQLDSTRR